jgi:hypothetical protein
LAGDELGVGAHLAVSSIEALNTVRLCEAWFEQKF